jgi:adenylate cyclase
LIGHLENRFLDYRFNNWSYEATPDSNIIIVSIDDNSLDYFAENGTSWPWPRSFYAHVVDYLTKAGASQIVFDMLFTHSDIDRSETDAEETDSLFANSIARSGVVTLGSVIDGKVFSMSMPIIDLGESGISNKTIQTYDSGITYPIAQFKKSCQNVGYTNILYDSDGVLRHVKPFFVIDDLQIPSLATAFIKNSKQVNSEWINDKFYINTKRVPIGNSGDLLIDWYGSSGPGGAFTYLSFLNVIQSASAERLGGKPAFNRDLFKGKIIIIGADASGLRDLKSTPVSPIDMHPGMEIWATVLSNFTQSDFIYPFPNIPLFLLLIGISISTLLSFDRMKARFAFIIMFGSILTFVLFSYILWLLTPRIFLPIVPALSVGIISYLVVLTNEMRERLFLKQVFGPYISPELMNVVYKTRKIPELGGEQINGTAFFSDLQHFTKISEKLGPTQLVTFLNEYLTDMTDILIKNGGTLDKYEGDAIIAFFGAPVHTSVHPVNAVHAAIDMQKRLGQLREKWQSEGDKWPQEVKNLQMRIGINSGEMLVGNVGSRGRMNYTMMGDTVNVAARLESSAKQYGISIHISDETAKGLPDSIALRNLGKKRLVGKSQASESYEVLGNFNELNAEAKRMLTIWSSALEAVTVRAWNEANDLFLQTNELESTRPGQIVNPSKLYLDIRLPYWRDQELDDNWEAIWEFENK